MKMMIRRDRRGEKIQVIPRLLQYILGTISTSFWDISHDITRFFYPRLYCICTCIMSLTAQIHFDIQLVYKNTPQESGSYLCKQICKQIRDMDINWAVDMRDKFIYMYAFWP
jgi:hypothetical protein